MTDKPQLILDMGGVLVTNLSPLFWQELTERAAIPYDALVKRYKQEMSEALWSGKISEEEFWTWLCKQSVNIDEAEARALLHANLKPLPAMEHLSNWSQFADIHLLSNHRVEWIGFLISPVRDYLKSVTISSNVGFCKPHPAIYSQVTPYLAMNKTVLFVDDQNKNFQQASLLGWETLLADVQGEWIENVRPLLLER